MYLADYHTHSATSPDGQLTVSELAEAAVRAGLDEICVTDHVDTVLWGDHRPREHFDWSRLLRELPEVPQELVPADSLLREFIGGCCFYREKD